MFEEMTMLSAEQRQAVNDAFTKFCQAQLNPEFWRKDGQPMFLNRDSEVAHSKANAFVHMYLQSAACYHVRLSTYASLTYDPHGLNGCHWTRYEKRGELLKRTSHSWRMLVETPEEFTIAQQFAKTIHQE